MNQEELKKLALEQMMKKLSGNEENSIPMERPSETPIAIGQKIGQQSSPDVVSGDVVAEPKRFQDLSKYISNSNENLDSLNLMKKYKNCQEKLDEVTGKSDVPIITIAPDGYQKDLLEDIDSMGANNAADKKMMDSSKERLKISNDARLAQLLSKLNNQI